MRKHLLSTAALAAMLTTAHAQSWLTNGLVAYYPFNGNAIDASGNGNNGTISNAVLTANRFGIANSAFSFNGTNAFVVVSNSASLQPAVITVSGWFWIDSAPSVQDAFCAAKYNNYQGWILKVATDLRPAFGIHKTPSTAVYAIAADPVPVKTWLHLAATYDGQNVVLYVNGQLASFTAYAGGYTPYSGTMKIATATHYTGSWLKGMGDDVRIYNRALSESEVAQLFSVEAGSLNIHKAVYLDTFNLAVGSNYQLQVSSDLNTWTNHGNSFTATNSFWRSTNSWDVGDWNQLFFRLKPQ